MPISVEVGGVWKPVTATSVEVGGVWKPVTAAWQEVGGAWKSLIASGVGGVNVWQFVGSSSTLGQKAIPNTEGFAYRAAFYSGWTAPDNLLFVDGVGSSRLTDYVTRFAANCDIHYNAGAANVVFVQHGINDLGTAAEVYANLVAFCTYVKGLHATNPWKVVVGTNQYPKHGSAATVNARFPLYDAMYMDNPDFHDGTIADGVVWPHTRLALTNSDSNRYDADGFHMNNLGHDIYGLAVSEELPIALTGSARLSNRPSVTVTSHASYATVAGTITVLATATGAAELELYAGVGDPSFGTGGVLRLEKVGATIAGNSGSWSLDTTAYADTNLQLAVSAKSAAGLGNSTATWVRVYQLAASGAPSFAAPPLSGEFTNGATVNLTAVATGTAPVTYQWESNLEGTWTTIAGATSSTYSLTCAIETLGSYRCTATNAVGSLTTEPVVVRMAPGGVLIYDSFSGASGSVGGRTPDKVGSEVWTGGSFGVNGSGLATTALSTRAHIETGLGTGLKVRSRVRLDHASASAGPVVRCNAAGTNYIRGAVTATTFSFRDNAGVIGTAYTFPVPKNLGDWIDVEVRVVGDVFTAYVDGALVKTQTITTYSTNTRAGIANAGNFAVAYDFFEASPYSP